VMMFNAASKVGAVIPGWSAVEELNYTNVVTISTQDLFPSSTIRLHGIKTFEKERIDLAILYAASILVKAKSTLRDIFLSVIEGKTEILYNVENLTCETGFGYMGWIQNNRIFVGSRAMMIRHDIEVPSLDYEDKYTKGTKCPIYLAVSGKLFGMFLVSYRADESAAAVVDDLKNAGISLMVRADDFNVTCDMISRVYDVEPECIKLLTQEELPVLASSTEYTPDSEGAMTHLGSFTSFIGGLRAAIGAASAERAATIIQCAAIIFSLVITLLLTVTGGIRALSLPAILMYQFAWLVLTVSIPLAKRY
ncbi:MAG: cell envelope biogenesis protein OmpA, partial [Oscillospiraceae bacterium]|nr:cell envelope biogenesis protein OmpA [Oscillospiraceae bacterium]